MTTCPAYVPTPDDAKPDASSATAKASATGAPATRSSAACTPSRVSTPPTASPKNSRAASTSIARLTRPAMPIAMTTSMRWWRSSVRVSARSTGSMRPAVSALCR